MCTFERNQLTLMFSKITPLLFFLFLFTLKTAVSGDADSVELKRANKIYSQAKLLRKSGNHEQSRILYAEAFKLYSSLGRKQEKADIYNELGISYYTTGEYDLAMVNFRYLLQESKESGNREDRYLATINMGCVYFDLGVYEKAVELFNETLEIAGKEKTEKRASALNLLANVFYVWEKHAEALELYKEALSINENVNNKRGKADNLNNIGNIYHEMDSLSIAYLWYLQSYEIERELDNKSGIAKSLNNLAFISGKQQKIDQAQNYHHQALEINRKLKDFPNMAWTLNMIGNLFNEQRQIDSALYYFHLAEKTLETIAYKNLQIDIFYSLSEIYDSLENHKLAFYYYQQNLILKDSVYNEKTANQIELLKIQYQTQKKILEIEAMDIENQKLESDREIQLENHARTRLVVNMLLFVLGLFLIFAFIIFYRYIKNRKLNRLLVIKQHEIIQQKEEIEAQRDEIIAQRNNILEQKEIVTIQKERITIQKANISESIVYAGKIQQTLLEGFNLPHPHFIMFRPRDVVSGDFYWVYKTGNKTIIAAADCTGHGVPGASMSVLGITYLRDLVVKNKVLKPSEILNKLRQKIIETLRQKSSESKSKDGIDMAIVCIDSELKTLSYAGANNPIYIVPENKEEFETLNPGLIANPHSNSQINKGILYEIKPDKMPIGVFQDNESLFSNITVNISLGEIVFLFSDGYADQFGGESPNGKKFKYKPFKDLLLEASDMSPEQQKHLLNKTLDNWTQGGVEREKPFEQVDDILVIGVRTE